MKLANLTSAYRARLIVRSYQNEILPTSRILDIGCGTGVVGKIIADHFDCDITGCDISDYRLRNIKFKRMNTIDKLPFRKKLFDVSMVNDVLHHMTYQTQEAIITEALRVSSKLLVFEMNPDILGKTLDLLLNKVHHRSMAVIYTYRAYPQWKKVVKDARLQIKQLPFTKPPLYPIHHLVFKVF